MKGLVAGFRTLCLSFVLLVAVLYVISGFATMTIGSDLRTTDMGLMPHFDTVPQSMFTAFLCFAGECIDRSGRPIPTLMAEAYGLPFVMGYVVSYMLVSMGIFNVILAVYVDITMKAAKETEAVTAEQHARESIRIARTTRELLKKFAAAYRLYQDSEASNKMSQLDFNTSSIQFTDNDIHAQI
ncbi:rlmN, partial [Symbiodinium pilosum]